LDAFPFQASIQVSEEEDVGVIAVGGVEIVAAELELVVAADDVAVVAEEPLLVYGASVHVFRASTNWRTAGLT
jgi:hypothetical protein